MRRPNEFAPGHNAENVVFAPPAFADLVAFIGLRPPETGGLLLGSRDDYVVTKFVFDDFWIATRSSYRPDVTVLDKIVKREWREHGLQLIGWAHSHPRGVERLSGDYGGGKGDVAYLTQHFFHAMPKLPNHCSNPVQQRRRPPHDLSLRSASRRPSGVPDGPPRRRGAHVDGSARYVPAKCRTASRRRACTPRHRTACRYVCASGERPWSRRFWRRQAPGRNLADKFGRRTKP